MSTLKIEEKFTVAAPVERVWQFLLSPELVASCLPGAALRGQEGADTYLGTMKIKVGPVTSEFKGKATMSDIDPDAHRLKLSGTGDDVSGGGSARMIMDLGVRATAEGSEVQVVADVDIAGKLVRFGRGMIEGVSKQLFKQFVERARDRIAQISPSDDKPAEEPGAETAAAQATGQKSQDVTAAAADSPASVDAGPKKTDITTDQDENRNGSSAVPSAAAAAENANPTQASADAAKPDDAKPDAAKPDAAKPDAAKPGDAKPDAAKPGDAKPDAAKPNDAKPDAANVDAAEAQTRDSEKTAGTAVAGSAGGPSPGRGPAPAPEASDITTGVLPRPKPRPLAIAIPKQEPEALDAGSLVFRALWEWLKSLFRRLLGRGT